MRPCGMAREHVAWSRATGERWIHACKPSRNRSGTIHRSRTQPPAQHSNAGSGMGGTGCASPQLLETSCWG